MIMRFLGRIKYGMDLKLRWVLDRLNHDGDLSALREKVAEQLMADVQMLFDDVALPDVLDKAGRYAMQNGGKRVRPLLVAATYLSLTKQQSRTESAFGMVRRAMMAVELIHGYSLVHDDLPCMDDDVLRRGQPTCHVVYGEATALLAGDVLQSLAFEVLSMAGLDLAMDLDIGQKLGQILSPRARRMVAGQQLDIAGEGKVLSQAELESIHKDKTGALIEASVLMGGACAGADERIMRQLLVYAQAIGLAFQVQDDVLDVVADTQTLGKMAGSDEKLQKSTYVKLLGVERASAYADELFEKAYQVARELDCCLLLDIITWLRHRQH